MDNKLNIYECDEIIQRIETQAEMNDGELSDDELQALVIAQTQSLEQLGKLVNYILYLESFDTLAKTEIDKIQAKRKVAANRVGGIKRWLLPYVTEHGPISLGIRRILTRKSKGVVLVDGFENPQYGDYVTNYKPDKKRIKESIESGIEVQGAVLEDRLNLQIR